MRPNDTVSTSQRGSAGVPGMVKRNANAAMSTKGQTKARAAASSRSSMSAGKAKTVQTGIMNKNRAIKGAMSYMGNQPAKAAKPSALSRQNAMSKNRAMRGAMGR